MEDLRRHVVCLDRTGEKVLWTKGFEPALPEHRYAGEGAYHGYAASTPVTDGKHLPPVGTALDRAYLSA